MMPEEIGYLVDPSDPEKMAETEREAANRAPGMDYEPAEPAMTHGAGGHEQYDPIHIPDGVTPFMPEYTDGPAQTPGDIPPLFDIAQAVEQGQGEGTGEPAPSTAPDPATDDPGRDIVEY
jgi:hypothetical protein